MASNNITPRRRRRRELRGKPLGRRRGLWQKLRSPNTLKLIFKIGFFIYRFFRWILEFLE